MDKDCYNCRYYGGEDDKFIYCDLKHDFVKVNICIEWRRGYSCLE